MKLALIAFVLAGLVFAGSCSAQAYDPYYDPYDAYDPYAPVVQYVQPYDPYYELHLIHYQLYLRPYSVYPYAYPFFVPRIVGPPPFVGAPVVAAPARVAPVRAAQPIRRR